MSNNRSGYSLFEVMIAFAVMTLVLTVLVPGQSTLLGRIAESDDSALAQDYAFSLIDKIGISEEPNLGTRTFIYRSWDVVRTITPESLEGVETEVLRIRIEVLDQAGKNLASVETLRMAE